MQAIDLVTGEETVELAGRVTADTARGIGLDMPMHLGMVQDLTQQVECMVGAARRCCTEEVKPAVHVLSPDLVNSDVTEYRQELASEPDIEGATGRRFQSFIAFRPPDTRDEVAEQPGTMLSSFIMVVEYPYQSADASCHAKLTKQTGCD